MIAIGTLDFLQKAQEYGLVQKMNDDIEAKKHEQRLAVLEQIANYPALGDTEFPEAAKQTQAAKARYDLAEAEFYAAQKAWLSLCNRPNAIESQWSGGRFALEREAQRLGPDFLQRAYEDLDLLDTEVQAQFHVNFEIKRDEFGRQHTVTTSNAEAVAACRKTIKEARAEMLALMLTPDSLDDLRLACAAFYQGAIEEAVALGVPRSAITDRRDPTQRAEKSTDSAIKRRLAKSNSRDADIGSVA